MREGPADRAEGAGRAAPVAAIAEEAPAAAGIMAVGHEGEDITADITADITGTDRPRLEVTGAAAASALFRF